MTDPGGLEESVANTLLDAELANKENLGVVILPQDYINNAATYRWCIKLSILFVPYVQDTLQDLTQIFE